jgi:hypothetical protein
MRRTGRGLVIGEWWAGWWAAIVDLRGPHDGPRAKSTPSSPPDSHTAACPHQAPSAVFALRPQPFCSAQRCLGTLRSKKDLQLVSCVSRLGGWGSATCRKGEHYMGCAIPLFSTSAFFLPFFHPSS